MKDKFNSSRITNGTAFFLRSDRVDKRTASGRRWHDIHMSFCERLGGYDRLDEPQRQDVRRASSLSVALEGLDARIARGEDVDIGNFSFLSNELQRCLQRLGLGRLTPKQQAYRVSSRR